MVEKPIAGSLQAVENIIAARNKTDRFVAVGYQHFYQPATQHVKEFLTSGALGKIQKIKLMGRWPRGNTYYQRNYWAGKIFGKHAPVLDSPFCNAFAHYVNMLLYLTGSDREKAAVPELISGELSRSRDIENFDSGIVNLTADGVPATIMLTHCCSVNVHPKLVISCEKGTVIYDETTTWQVYDADGKAVEGFDYPGRANHTYLFDAVVNRVTDPTQRICTPELAMEHVRLMEQMYKKCEIKTMPQDAYTIREADGVRINKGLEEAWEELFKTL
jgi:predicted dehydrogenase